MYIHICFNYEHSDMIRLWTFRYSSNMHIETWFHYEHSDTVQLYTFRHGLIIYIQTWFGYEHSHMVWLYTSRHGLALYIQPWFGYEHSERPNSNKCKTQGLNYNIINSSIAPQIYRQHANVWGNTQVAYSSLKNKRTTHLRLPWVPSNPYGVNDCGFYAG